MSGNKNPECLDSSRPGNVLSAKLVLETGAMFHGVPFGSKVSRAGEVVFNTGLVGYPESLTDPSYHGQILVLTYPLVGNYGVPRRTFEELDRLFESAKLQISGLVVSTIAHDYSHWNGVLSLSEWLRDHNVPAISSVDTRAITKLLRERGTMLGEIICGCDIPDRYNPNEDNLVAKVSCKSVRQYDAGEKKVVVVDCGCKNSIIHSLIERDISVIRVPWDLDFTKIDYDGVLISNGPGDPKMCAKTIRHLKKAMTRKKPMFGICLGNQLIALAAGADTYKLKYGHRSQNQPCIEHGQRRCYITSQNHGYAVSLKSVPSGWMTWFKNANDGTIEGIRHDKLPFMGVQFHPEARPGPTDTKFLFDDFVGML